MPIPHRHPGGPVCREQSRTLRGKCHQAQGLVWEFLCGPFSFPLSGCKSPTLFPCQPHHRSSYHPSPLRTFPPSPKLFPQPCQGLDPSVPPTPIPHTPCPTPGSLNTPWLPPFHTSWTPGGVSQDADFTHFSEHVGSSVKTTLGHCRERAGPAPGTQRVALL